MAACPHPEKHWYPTKAKAKAALRRLSTSSCRDLLHAYRCPCGGFHLGHKPGSRKNRDPRPRLA